MKGLADKPNCIIEILEGGLTLEDVFDGHIGNQALVSSICRAFMSWKSYRISFILAV